MPETHCLNCTRLARQLQLVQIDLENAEISLRSERKAKREAQAALAKQRTESPERALAQALFDYWNLVCRNGKAREFSGKRLECVLARLKHYHAVHIVMGIQGAASDPYIAPGGKVFDDLELICRDASKLDSFIERCEREQERLRTLAAEDEYVYPRWVLRGLKPSDPPEVFAQRATLIQDKECEAILMDPREVEPPKERSAA